VTRRRLPLMAIVLAAIVGAVWAGQHRLQPEYPAFSAAAIGWMPAAPPVGGVTETWFCPGVPATGVDDVGGSMIIVNRTSELRVGTVLVFNERAENRRLELSVDPYTTARVDLDATLAGEMVGGVVEVDGGGVLVEQQSFHPSGNSSAACSNATSDTWYLADGSTVDGSLDQVVLSNPYDQTVIASLQFATREGSRAPSAYDGITVPARSTRVIDLGAPGAGAQGEPVLAVTVQSTRGRLVVGRFQRFLGGGRLGTQVTLASPAPREQWWFANGFTGEGVTERYSIYNPTDDDVQVDPIFVGIPDAVQLDDPISVPAHEVVVFEPALVTSLPAGPYALVFSALDQPSVVIERATTTQSDDDIATTVIAGATPRPDGYLATSWYVAEAPGDATAGALVIYTADNATGTVTVSAIGASGPVPVPGLIDVVVPGPGAVLRLDLTDPSVVGRPLLIESDNRIFVERAFPDGRGDLRYSAWAIPVS
jgi:hypothetical protein